MGRSTREMRKESGADDMDETRNQMFLSLESDFDSLLFDCNWMDGQNSGNNSGLQPDTNDGVKVEARQSLLMSGHEHQGSFQRQTNIGAVSSMSSLPNFATHEHDMSGHNGANYQQCESTLYHHAFQDKTLATNGSMSTAINPILQTLAFNAMAAGVNMSTTSMPPSFGMAPQMQQTVAATPHQQQQEVILSTVPSQQQKTMTQHGSNPPSSHNLPPFLLFDAPIELRANFMASQRAHGLPPLADSNTLHYQLQSKSSSSAATNGLRLIDGRHGDVGNNRVKNEREQKRTQKIADLIDQLREKMEHGGWKVGGTKSKYATLSTCAEYVKHLVNANKEKELALEKTKSDLEAKRRKVEDESSTLVDPSEPESTTSSLTVSLSSPSGPTNRSGRGTRRACSKRRSGTRKQRVSCEQLPGGYCNRRSNECDSRSDDDDDEQSHVNKEISQRKRKAPSSPEATSMDSAFELDYEEVFLKSNVPQLLASTSGRIISWNDFFLKVTSLAASDVERLTIFSLVLQSELSRLFEIVAAALRSGNMNNEEQDEETHEDKPEQSSFVDDEEKSRISDITTTGKWNYTAITLPCTTFRPRTTTASEGSKVVDKPLYMTVTLMTDDDPRKRCFHCVFTDCPGTNGALGSVTPELLSLLFTQQKTSASLDDSMEGSPDDLAGRM